MHDRTQAISKQAFGERQQLRGLGDNHYVPVYEHGSFSRSAVPASIVDAVPFAGELPAEFSAESFAGACRRGYLLLLSGALRGWGKAELANWLGGPYERLACSIDDASSSWPPPSSGSVKPARITELLDFVRADVLIVLRELTAPAGLRAFATQAVDTRLVALSRDLDGTETFVPRSRPRMSLVDRALSLVAVDALVRPSDYTEALFICTRCEMPTFDRVGRVLDMCAVHRSGFNVRES